MLVFRSYKLGVLAVLMVSMFLLPTSEAFGEMFAGKLRLVHPPRVAEMPVIEVEEEPLLQITYDPFEVTQLTQEDFDYILAGTGLEDCGAYFEDIEGEYNVNGIYAVAVALYESGDGYSGLATYNHNYFGFRGTNGWMSFESPADGILYFGKLMNYDMYFQKEIEDIGKVYCPGSWDSWSNKIRTTMEGLFDKLNAA